MTKYSWIPTILIAIICLSVIPASSQAAPTASPASNGIIQMHNAGNGYFFMLGFTTPSSSTPTWISDGDQIHTNALEIYVFNTQQPTETQFNVSMEWNNSTQHQAWKAQANYQQMQLTTIQTPSFSDMTTVNLTIGNDTMQIGLQSIPTASIPFYDTGAQGFLMFLGIVLTAATIAGIGIAGAILKRTKYFPPLSQRAWIALIVFGGIGMYTLYSQYYYLTPTIPWPYLILPFVVIICLIVLDSYPSETKDTLLIQMKDEPGKGEITTGIWSIKTAACKEWAIPSETNEYRHSGMQYIDARSYRHFLMRLFGQNIDLAWNQGEYPAAMPEPSTRRIQWKMKDRKDKEHPYEEGYLLSPNATPTLKRIERHPEARIWKGKHTILHIPMSGKHMQLVHEFLADYTSMVQAGASIMNLTKENAQLRAAAKLGNAEMQHLIIEDLGEMLFETNTPTPKPPEKLSDDTKEEDRK